MSAARARLKKELKGAVVLSHYLGTNRLDRKRDERAAGTRPPPPTKKPSKKTPAKAVKKTTQKKVKKA